MTTDPQPETTEPTGRTVNDMRELYAVQHAITDAGGLLTPGVHKALDALREAWDIGVRREQAEAHQYRTALQGAARAAVAQSAPAETALRDRIAAAIKSSPFEELRTVDHAPNGPLQITAKVDDLADAVLAAQSAADLPAGEAYRLAVSAALRLGTGATWEAIRDRAEDLTAEVQGLTEAHVRQMEAAASVDRAVVLNETADHLARQAADASPSARDVILADAAELRRLADETQPAEAEPTESVIYEVVGDWGVDGADSAEGARASVAKWLRAYPKCGAYAQQRIVRMWDDGSEFYGPWTGLPEPTAAASQPGKEH
jgi:hypothetical protein